MSILGSLISAVRASTSDLPLLPLSQAMRGTWLWEALGGGDGLTVSVTERNAIQLSAVWTCVNIRAGLLASLPLKVYQRLDRGRRVAREQRLYPLLHDAPSAEDTSYTFRHKLASSLLLTGNGYAEIEYDRARRVRAIYPWPKAAVKPQLGEHRGEFWYEVTDSSGQRRVEPRDMLHLRGFCFEGVEGLSVIGNHRRSLGIAVRTEVFANSFYDNGARASGVLMYPGQLGEKARANLEGSFQEKQAGVQNAGKTIVLEEGTKYQQLTIPPDDAQFLETRQLSRAEVAGIFRIPPMLVPGAQDSTPTYASSESFMRYVIDFTLRDDLTLWEQELNNKLFAGTDFYVEFDTHDLERADSAGRAALYKALWEIGVRSANDICETENWNPVAGGDRYYVPLNYIPVDKVDQALDAKSQPGAPPVKPALPAGGKQMPQGYRRLFAETIREIQAWESWSEKRASAKLLGVLRALADDLVGPANGARSPSSAIDGFLAKYSTCLAQRARSLASGQIAGELDRAVEEINAHGDL